MCTLSGTARKFIEAALRIILVFHSIDDSGSVLSYPAKSLDGLLEALECFDIPVMTLDKLLLPETRCGVSLTFDDGIRSVFTDALPVLRSHSAPAHLFLTTGYVGLTNRWPSQPAHAPLFDMLSWSEIEALQAAGMRVEAHTSTHPDLRRLSDYELQAECERADEAIATKLGCPPSYFAYPYSLSDARIRAFARRRYAGSLGGGTRTLRRREDIAALPRVDSYYLRSQWIYGNLRSRRSQVYLLVRRALRRLRNAP
jgi:peptidoglycan/xylan/chitin deacetylase (PgdA/CDA1 family)